MASNFAFLPMGLSQAVTVGGGAPATISLVVQGVGNTNTLQITNATATVNYVPKCVRVSNDGTASAFINFGASAGTVSVSTSNGIRVRNGTDPIFQTGGLPIVAATCAGTFTTTLIITPGEGIS